MKKTLAVLQFCLLFFVGVPSEVKSQNPYDAPTQIVFTIDWSASMRSHALNFVEMLRQSLESDMINLDTTSIAIITFGKKSTTVLPLTMNKVHARHVLDSLSSNPPCGYESNALFGFFESQDALISDEGENATLNRYIVFVCDGFVTDGSDGIEFARYLERSHGIDIYSVHFPSIVGSTRESTAYMKAIATDRDHYILMPEKGIFSKIR